MYHVRVHGGSDSGICEVNVTVKFKMLQTCNVGGEEREIDILDHTRSFMDIPQVAELGGWRELNQGNHICPKCIDKVTKHK